MDTEHKQATIHFCAGLLIRRQIRDTLEDFIFTGLDFTYRESKGWIDSTFILKGKANDLRKVNKILCKHFQD